MKNIAAEALAWIILGIIVLMFVGDRIAARLGLIE